MNYSLDLEQYLLEHIDDESQVLSDLNRQTHIKMLQPRMLSGHLQGQILKMLVQMIGPMNILEIGTYTGYSAISMAQGLEKEGAHIDTIEINDELEPFVNPFLKKAGLEDVITLHIGNALDVIPTLDKTFDMVFIDGDKRLYSEYYEMVLGKLNPGGYILADNVLWDGKILKKPDPKDTQTISILEFNKKVKNDERVEKVILPIRDGIFLIRKKL